MVDQKVEHVKFIEEVHVLLDALLVERLQNHVAGAVGGKAGAAHGAFAEVAGVAAEGALVNLAFGRAVEGQAHVLQVVDHLNRLAAHDLYCILVTQVVAALDRVEDVPLPVVFLNVAKRSADAALGRARMRAGGVELGQDGHIGSRDASSAAIRPAPPAPTITAS